MGDRPPRLTPDVVLAIRTMHPGTKRRVREALDRIRAEPECGKALTGELASWRSLRVGRLRIIYHKRHRTIDIAAIGPRESIYIDAVRRLGRSAND